MKWLWWKARGNRHAWREERRVASYLGGDVHVARMFWHCPNCDATVDKYHGLATVIPPEFGCHERPIPAFGAAADAGGLPVVREDGR